MMIGAELMRMDGSIDPAKVETPDSLEPSKTVLFGLTGGIQGTISLSMSDVAAIG